MNSRSILLLFLLTTCGIVGALYGQSDDIVLLLTVPVTALAVGVAFRLCMDRYFMTAGNFSFHFLMYLFTLYAFIYRDRVVGSAYDFSVFTENNLRTATIALALVSGIIATVVMTFGKPSLDSGKANAYDFLLSTVGRFGALTPGIIGCLITTSFLWAILMACIAPSVFQISYPFNRAHFPLPAEDTFLKVPQLLAAVALMAVHVKRLQPGSGSGHSELLLFARANFAVSPLLCLIILGARANTTFMWLAFGFVELVLFLKHRNTARWGLFFLLLAYLAYTIWPFLRYQVAITGVGEALAQSLNYLVIGMAPEGGGDNSIDMMTFPVISQSLFHLLYVIELESCGISLSGSSFFNLGPNVLPEFLDGVLWTRPVNEAWLLNEYFPHGGGFFVVANLYWNGGMMIMAASMGLLSAAFLYFDHQFQNPHVSLLYRWGYFLMIPVAYTQWAYGLQGLVRPLELFALLVIIERLVISSPALPIGPRMNTVVR